MVEFTRWVVILGYGFVVVFAWYSVGRMKNPSRRIAAVLFAVSGTAWVVFYMWVATLDLVGDSFALTAASLGSRLAHLPAIGTGIALLVMLNDSDRAADDVKKKLVEKVSGGE